MSGRPFRSIRNQRERRRAFTLIELLVAVMILAILAVLVLAAVQSSRNAARKTQCISNLRQMGLALQGYVGTHGSFPAFSVGKGYSIHVAMLPYLENNALYHAINLGIEHTGGPDPHHSTAMHMSLTVFMCPADVIGFENFGANYAGNRGYGYTNERAKDNGLFTLPRVTGPVTFASITDGTGTTAAFSEWLISNNAYSRKDPQRTVFETPERLPEESQFDRFVAQCTALDPQTAKKSAMPKGRDWLRGDKFRSLYDHNLPPNGHSCLNKSLVQQGASTACSAHGRGANTAFVDGHVRFVRETIALEVWRSLATRGGGEVISADASY